MVSIRENDNSTDKSPEENQKLGEAYKLKKHKAGGVGKRFFVYLFKFVFAKNFLAEIKSVAD